MNGLNWSELQKTMSSKPWTQPSTTPWVFCVVAVALIQQGLLLVCYSFKSCSVFFLWTQTAHETTNESGWSSSTQTKQHCRPPPPGVRQSSVANDVGVWATTSQSSARLNTICPAAPLCQRTVCALILRKLLRRLAKAPSRPTTSLAPRRAPDAGMALAPERPSAVSNWTDERCKTRIL